MQIDIITQYVVNIVLHDTNFGRVEHGVEKF